MSMLKDLKQMHPELIKKYQLFRDAMLKANLQFLVTSVSRSVKEQFALYAQGREPLTMVNKYRKLADLPSITLAQNVKVTWTLKSKHIIDLDDGDTSNDLSRAFDIVLIDGNKKVSWDIKMDVNKNKIADYIEAGKIGESVGLKWGGRFKSPDYPHFEI